MQVKKSLVLILVFVMLATTVSFGTIGEKLSNHWAKNEIDKMFVASYFPYLAKSNFEKFDPSGPISEQEFNLSLNTLLKDLGFEVKGLGGTYHMSRGDMANILGKKLVEVGVKDDSGANVPFKDINTINSSTQAMIKLLYNKGILKGDSNSSFGPVRGLSQVEAIITLQRVKSLVENMNNIAFETLGIVQTFNNQEEIIVINEENRVLVTVTKQFPTPGYSMSVNKIMKVGGDYKIYFNITPPNPDSIQLQVITYKTLTLAINKSELGNPPYKFTFDGYNKITIKEAM